MSRCTMCSLRLRTFLHAFIAATAPLFHIIWLHLRDSAFLSKQASSSRQRFSFIFGFISAMLYRFSFMSSFVFAKVIFSYVYFAIALI